MKNIRKLLAAACVTALFLEGAQTTVFAAGAWDKVDGQYVDASGAPVSGALFKGITVTKYQNRANGANAGIDWKKVAASGVDFAMVRLGYYKDFDPYYAINMQGAAEYGIKVGAFFYTQALDTQTAVDEARYVLNLIRDFPVSYPVAYDVESKYLLENGLTKQQITDNINAFCRTIEAAGYRPIVYLNEDWRTNHVDTDQIPYDIWYARYGSVNDCQNRTIWQCSKNGRVDGIDGEVTIELSFVDYGSLIPADSWKQIDGNWYYMKNYRKQIGWVEVDGVWYYLDPNGAMVRDTTMEINGVSYTFGSDGAMKQ